jgi:photosystem II stability/assembly factor-like uncharacterized protein
MNVDITRQNGLNTIANWIACCCNIDCTKFAVFTNTNGIVGIYIVTPGSVTTVASSNLPNNAAANFWRGATCSHDFTKIIAVRDGGGIYYSTDSGATWAASTNAPTRKWFSVAGNADLSIAYAVSTTTNQPNLYKSTNYGQTWTSMYSTNVSAHFVCCSWNAQYVAVCIADNTQNTSNFGILVSSDSGASWTGKTLTRTAATFFRSICCSSDFKTVAAVAKFNNNFSKLWISYDYGANWTDKSDNFYPGFNVDTVAISGSSNLQNMIICNYTDNASTWFSTDYGESWRLVHVPGIQWHATCFSKNSNKAVVVKSDTFGVFVLDFYNGQSSLRAGQVLINVEDPTNTTPFSSHTSQPILHIRNSSPLHHPVACNYVASNSTSSSRLTNYTIGATVGTLDTYNNADSIYYYWKSGGTKRYYFKNTSQTLFTGQHKALPDDPNIKINLYEHVGLIMSSNDTGYTSYDNSKNIYSGKRAIYINEALPNCSLSVIDEDPCVFGVITNSTNGNNGRHDDTNTEFCTSLNDSVRVNSLGEGALWVSNINGPIKNGDWITTSQISGVGKKQSEIRRCNYTVAKATMSCDFENGSANYKTKMIEFKGQKYIMAFIGVTYHCG